jgi:hypothetical protein
MLTLLPAILLLVLANYSEKKKEYRIITRIFLFLFVILLMLEGLISSQVSLEEINTINYGYGTALTAIISLFIFIRPIRIWISRLIDIDPENWLHATALVFAILLAGTSLATAISVDVIAFSQSSGVGGSTVLIQDALLVLASFLGVGWLSRKKLKQCLKRLGIVKPSIKDLAWSVVFTGLLFLIVITIGMMSLLLSPESSVLETQEDPTVQILGSITILSALLFALGAGIGEEILFRGAIQPRFGIILTSIIFAVMHIQYLDIISMSTLFLISVSLGYERKITNTTAAIITHTLYDLILLLMVALA